MPTKKAATISNRSQDCITCVISAAYEKGEATARADKADIRAAHSMLDVSVSALQTRILSLETNLAKLRKEKREREHGHGTLRRAK